MLTGPSRPPPRSRPAGDGWCVSLRTIPSSATAIGAASWARAGTVPRRSASPAEGWQRPGSRARRGPTLVLPDGGAVLRIAVGIGDAVAADPDAWRAAGAASHGPPPGIAGSRSVAAIGGLGRAAGRGGTPRTVSLRRAAQLHHGYGTGRADRSSSPMARTRPATRSRAPPLRECHDARAGPCEHAPQPPDRDPLRRGGGRRRQPPRGLEVEVFERDALVAMGIGGLLGVNAGSAEQPV